MIFLTLYQNKTIFTNLNHKTKGSPIMKKLTKSLTHFTLFSAAACAILFGLPALATRHPFILLAVFQTELILTVYAIHKPADNPKAAKHRTATHRKAA